MQTKSKAILKKALFTILAVVFWLCVWEVAAIILARPLILPHVPEVLRELGRMISEGGFALTVTLSLSRVLLGFILGTLAGAVIGTLTAFIPPFDTLLSPIISVVRATPVASFIMVIWSLISSSAVPTAIALLMVMPVVAQSTAASFRAIDRQLTEVAEVFDFSLGKKIRLLWYPALTEVLLPGIITAAGLAWKAGIAAEIISYTKNSIGREIHNAKAYFETERLFAWTLIVIILSLIIEKILKLLLKKCAGGIKSDKH